MVISDMHFIKPLPDQSMLKINIELGATDLSLSPRFLVITSPFLEKIACTKTAYYFKNKVVAYQ